MSDSLEKTLDSVDDLPINILQFFLFRHQENRYLRILPEDQKRILLAKQKCSEIYAHSSYWINLAHGNKESFKIAERLLLKELSIAEKLSLDGLVIHPGSYKAHREGIDESTARQAALEQIARLLNRLFKKSISIPIIFENTTHQKKTIGSDFKDFQDLKKLLDQPDKLLFCLDFAHAHAFGYDISQTEEFIHMLETHMDLTQIKLLHLNDAAEKQGSSHDRHELIGKGEIGINPLKKLALHPKLSNKPIVLELPKTTKGESIEMIELVKSWYF